MNGSRKLSAALAAALLAAPVLLLEAAPPARAAEAAKPEAAKPESEGEKSWNEMKLDSKRQKIDAMAGESLDNLLKSNASAKSLFGKSYGYAVLDNLKFGFFFSGGGGKGVAVAKASKARTYMGMGSAGAGLTFGGQKCQIVILFQDEKTFANFLEGRWAASGTASATAAQSGAGAGTQFVNGVAYYQIGEKGLMASADLSGVKFWKDKDLN